VPGEEMQGFRVYDFQRIYLVIIASCRWKSSRPDASLLPFATGAADWLCGGELASTDE
jgi:hypothetical protein